MKKGISHNTSEKEVRQINKKMEDEKVMNRNELIEAAAKRSGLSKKDAGAVLTAIIDEIAETMKKGDKVQLVGFGTFEPRKRAARVGKNPKTGEKIDIPAIVAPAFKPGKALKDALN